MLDFCNINENMTYFRPQLWRGRWNSWIKGLVFIGDYGKGMTQNTEGKMLKTPRKRSKKAKVKKSNKSRLNSLLLLQNRFMRNGLLISTITWPHLKGEQVTSSGLITNSLGFTNALKNGQICLEPLEPFPDIDPLVSEPSIEQDNSNMLQFDQALIQHLSSEDEKDSCDSEWKFEDWNAFDVISWSIFPKLNLPFSLFLPRHM